MFLRYIIYISECFEDVLENNYRIDINRIMVRYRIMTRITVIHNVKTHVIKISQINQFKVNHYKEKVYLGIVLTQTFLQLYWMHGSRDH